MSLIYIKVLLHGLPSVFSFLMEFISGDPTKNKGNGKTALLVSGIAVIIGILSFTAISFMEVAAVETAKRKVVEKEISVLTAKLATLDNDLSASEHLVELQKTHLTEARSKLATCRTVQPALPNKKNKPTEPPDAGNVKEVINSAILRNLGVYD